MKKKKPIIGLTSSILDIEVKGEVNPAVHTNHQYVKAVTEIGGIPIVIPVSNEDMAKEYIDICDGLIFTSGEDVDPSRYNQEPEEELQEINFARDETEIPLAKYAIEKKVPIMGTCRGLGIINVALGGTMKQDLGSGHNQEAYRKLPTHEIDIKEDSQLYHLFGEKKAMVNSKHHQAVDKLADSLSVAAISDDDVIEAVESNKKDQFILGLQFHPEELFAIDSKMLNLLMSFRQACEKNAR
ncbi:gamma-glutamyl-gamma-aminobutyrate hydrolase family protein [Oceanobacillus damuensis]|uniref:gamma-glutamyl-gamma-aminobutyrate hydrolase family protein n=1 Tax=Oceanobacillus damuensis TaxID=937928 RepID=UPI00083513FB|nr:gamma-glutamyl-gamma-aminobutyrate hydrolase family protein [Oceanobacillus damuensis]